ncbi:MAG TPA: FkbM family methyltransferase [Blastocatellia bacterium]|nr:FkbM family methyltransferase [Blastocatellia bacterium]
MQVTINRQPMMTQALISSGVFRPAPLRILDGGARHGAESQWDVYGRQAEIIAFEPDAEECKRLNETTASQTGPRVTYYPVALGREKKMAALHVANFPDSSSLLPTNHVLMDRFAMVDYLTQVRTVMVETTDIDSFVDESRVGHLDFMKLDVEGAELATLEGAGKALNDSLLGLIVEVWFQPEHVGRPLFAHIDEYLRGFGYTLFDIRDLMRWRRKTQCGSEYQQWVGRGQLMYANALYLRDIPGAMIAGEYQISDRSRMQLLKLASVAELFGYNDFALEVLKYGHHFGVLKKEEVESLSALLAEKPPTPAVRLVSHLRAGLRRVVPRTIRTRIRSIIQSSS